MNLLAIFLWSQQMHHLLKKFIGNWCRSLVKKSFTIEGNIRAIIQLFGVELNEILAAKPVVLPIFNAHV